MRRTVTEETLYGLLHEHAVDVRLQQALQLWEAVLAAKANPITSGSRALFLHWTEASTVQLVGDWTFWQPSAPLHRIAGTQLHYVVLEFPEDARLQYKIVVDGTWKLDPANGRVVEEGFGYNNEFWMPRYRDTSFLDIGQPVPSGTLERQMIESAVLSMHREVYYYIPRLDRMPPAMNLLESFRRFLIISTHWDELNRRLHAFSLPAIATLSMQPVMHTSASVWKNCCQSSPITFAVAVSMLRMRQRTPLSQARP
jgi:hypothetical protein